MAKQRLYTETQVLRFFNFYESANQIEYDGYKHPTMGGSERLHNNQTTKNILNAYTNSITAIELPSDEEIDTIAKDRINLSNECFGEYTFTSGKQDGFYEGAKWLRDKILNQ